MSVQKLPEDNLDDYTVTCTEKELKALTEIVKDADGRKSEVKLARDVLGL